MATIEQVEGETWPDPGPHATTLVRRCTALRRKELTEFTTEDLRIMLGQQVAVPILLPMAVAVLLQSPFAEGCSWDPGSCPFRAGTGWSMTERVDATYHPGRGRRSGGRSDEARGWLAFLAFPASLLLRASARGIGPRPSAAVVRGGL